MLCGHSDALEADLSRYHPRDGDQLAAFWRGEMTWRRLWVLLSQLPPESACGAALAGGWERSRWTPATEFAADLVELLQHTNHMIGAYLAGSASPPKPNPVSEPIRPPRPFDDEQEG